MNTEFSSSEIRGSQRRRKDTNSDDHQPLFLKKCYHMISTSPPDISSWSEDGQSFIIYDVNRFSSELIPTVYKHNKFPSFVRQLNFCKYSYYIIIYILINYNIIEHYIIMLHVLKYTIFSMKNAV